MLLSFMLRLLRTLLERMLVLVSSRRVLVEGESMAPALTDGDRLLAGRLAYRLTAPKRGDIVLLCDPSRPGSECIKRILALPQEIVRLDGLVATVSEDAAGAGVEEWKLGPGEYFVTGDNVAHSTDSRSFGPVKGSAILGRVWYRYRAVRGRAGVIG
jgi:signal peptidase I